jgi:hypothetical protein
MKKLWQYMPTMRARWRSKVAEKLFSKNAKNDKHHSFFTLVRKLITATFSNLIHSKNECVGTWNAWIILQIWIRGWRSINGSMVALKLLFMHNLNIPCWTSNCHDQAKLDLPCFFITPQHFWLVIPSLQYFHVFSKRSFHNWIATNITSPWHQQCTWGI